MPYCHPKRFHTMNYRLQREGHLIICQDVHTFGYLARSNYPPNAKNIGLFVLSLGWVVEGRNKSQLPEQLLASLRVVRVDPTTQNYSGSPDALLQKNQVKDGVEIFSTPHARWIKEGRHLM